MNKEERKIFDKVMNINLDGENVEIESSGLFVGSKDVITKDFLKI
jgi:hypothetical protein